MHSEDVVMGQEYCRKSEELLCEVDRVMVQN